MERTRLPPVPQGEHGRGAGCPWNFPGVKGPHENKPKGARSRGGRDPGQLLNKVTKKRSLKKTTPVTLPQSKRGHTQAVAQLGAKLHRVTESRTDSKTETGPTTLKLMAES